MTTKTVTEGVTRLAWPIPHASQATGLSERSLWAAIARGDLGSIKVGRRRLIPDADLRRFLKISAK